MAGQAVSLTETKRTQSSLALCIFLCSCFLAGCASRYALHTEKPQIALQWPYQPQPPKLVYVQSLNGFSESTSVLKSVAGTGGGKSANSFILPVSIAVGGDGRIAVADLGRRCVHLYYAGKNKYKRLSGASGKALVSPVSVVFDAGMRLYVSDSAGRVVVYGNDASFQFDISDAGGEPLKRPTGLAVSSARDRLYVVDTLASRINVFDLRGRFQFSFGQRGVGNGRFNFPTHIFRSQAGALYVTDSMNFRIAIFDEDGKFQSSFGHHGDGSGDLAMPKGVAVDRDEAVYVGAFLLTRGGRGGVFGEFWLPSGITIDASGLLYVCDTYNRRIQVFRITESYHAGA
jgi:DNA-binding beta-propeller fold protein YncE